MSPYNRSTDYNPCATLSTDAVEFRPADLSSYPKWSNATDDYCFKWSTNDSAPKSDAIVDCFKQLDEPLDGHSLQQLDGEAVNTLCDSYSVPAWDSGDSWAQRTAVGLLSPGLKVDVPVGTDLPFGTDWFSEKFESNLTPTTISISPALARLGLSSESSLNKWIEPIVDLPRSNISPNPSPWTRSSSTDSPACDWVRAKPEADVGGEGSTRPLWADVGLGQVEWTLQDSEKLAEKLLPFSNVTDEDENPYSNPRFKTEFCRNFREKGTCLYGDQCQFAHGKTELRQDIVRHSKYKTKFCQKFWIGGWCVYGPRCNFIHLEDDGTGGTKEGGSKGDGGSKGETTPGGLKPFQLQLRKTSESSVDSGIETNFSLPPLDMPPPPIKKIIKKSSPTPMKVGDIEEKDEMLNIIRSKLSAGGIFSVDKEEELALCNLLVKSGLGRNLMGLGRENDSGRGFGRGFSVLGSRQDVGSVAHPEYNPIPAPKSAGFDTWSTPQFYT